MRYFQRHLIAYNWYNVRNLSGAIPDWLIDIRKAINAVLNDINVCKRLHHCDLTHFLDYTGFLPFIKTTYTQTHSGCVKTTTARKFALESDNQVNALAM